MTKPTRTRSRCDVMPDIAPALEPAVPEPTARTTAMTIVEAENLPTVEDFDLAEYDWVPVRRKVRHDGWTVATQQAFIGVLADTGSVTQAAREVNMSATSCYRLRRAADGAAFAAAWDAAVQTASLRLVDLAFDRAINGSPEPVFDRDGNRIGQRVRFNDRLLMFLLRAHQPDRYRTPGQSPAPAPIPVPPVDTTLAALAPPMPAEPHRLMAPEALVMALEVADIRAEPVAKRRPASTGSAPSVQTFEAQLAAAKATIPPKYPERVRVQEGEDDHEGPGRRRFRA